MIDFHTHLGKVLHGYPGMGPEDLLRFMDQHGIGMAVVQPLVAPEEEDYYYTTEQALADCSRYPDRLIPFANMDPRRGTNDGKYDFYPVLKEYVDQGCRGFGEILANLPTNDPRMKGIYRACGRLGLPVVFDFRLSTEGVIEPVGLPHLEECLREFPETIFVGHGPGWWAEIAADPTPEDKNRYPRGPVRSPGRACELLERYPNMYADLSADSGYNALDRDRAFAREFLIRHHRKLLFGTDWFARYRETRLIGLLEDLDLPAEAKGAIYEGNARRLLGL